MTEDEFHTLEKTLRKMEFVCELGASLEAACDGSFLCWHRIVVPIYLEDVAQFGADPHRIQVSAQSSYYFHKASTETGF